MRLRQPEHGDGGRPRAAGAARLACGRPTRTVTVGVLGKPAAYGVGLTLAVVPPLGYTGQIVGDFLTTPSQREQEAGRGYFSTPADRALADAVVAGDAAKVASLLPAANPNAVGWNGMTFMRLALLDGHVNPDVVAALLRAGANPDQGQQMLFGSVNDGSGTGSGAMITGKNERLLLEVIDAGVNLNGRDLEGQPRFFSALRMMVCTSAGSMATRS